MQTTNWESIPECFGRTSVPARETIASARKLETVGSPTKTLYNLTLSLFLSGDSEKD
jgi:hypothetical protein